MQTAKRLWKLNNRTGYWDYQRSVTDETAAAWLARFREDEPEADFKVSLHRPKPPALTPNAPKVDYAYLNLIEHRKRAFAEVRRTYDARDAEIRDLGLDRQARREALEASFQERSAAQDRVNARHPLAPAPDDDDLEPNASSPDLSHLNALELRLSHERERLRAARTPREKAFRAQQVASAEREISGEREFLRTRGIDLSIDDDVASLSDDELLAELEPNTKTDWARTGLADLHRQGFMKAAFATPKQPKATPKPSAGCDLCQDWHEPGKHRYVVWAVSGDVPLSDGKPFTDLKQARHAAESRAISARLDQAISRGREPDHPAFKIVGRYEAVSGELLRS